MLHGLSGVLTLHHYRFAAWDLIRSQTVYIWSPLLPLTPLVFWFATRNPFQPDRLWSSLSRHLLMMLAFSLVHGYLSALLYYHIGLIEDGMREYQPWQHTGHFLFTHNNVYLLDALIYSILVASQNISQFHRRVRRQELDAATLEAQLAESKLRALKMQIHPHFLFNTLNSISVLVKKGDNARADEMLSLLSAFFRRTLEQSEEQTVCLQRELDLIAQYLAIEHVRFGERLQVEYRIDADCQDMPVPLLILQPLVENAIKHGLGGKVGPCHLRISARKVSQGLNLSVADDGAGTAEARADGIGQCAKAAAGAVPGSPVRRVRERSGPRHLRQHHARSIGMKVLIVDDEALAREGVRLMLEQIADVQIVGECDNGLDAVEAIAALQPDLVLLDIQMPGLDGLDVVARIGAAHMPLVVFLTAYDRHAVEAFRVNAFDYLLKPVADDRFRESLDRARKALTERRLQEQAIRLDRVLAQLSRRAEARPERLMIRTTGRISFVRPGDITRVEAEGDYVMIHSAGKRHLVRETMKQMQERLAPYGFQRIHRSSLVNLDAVRELVTDDNGDYHVILHDDTRLKLSRASSRSRSERRPLWPSSR